MALLAAAGVFLGACAPIPRPRVLDDADRASEAPAVVEAKQLAAGAWSVAEKLRADAHRAADEGQTSRAQWLAEQALAVYAEAVDASRRAKAVEREQRALLEVERVEGELGALDAEQAALALELAQLELRLRVARDAEAPQPAGAATGAREQARREAARAMRVEARLLCAAARILAPAGAAPAKPGASAPSSSSAVEPEDPTAPAILARDLAQAEAWLDELDRELAPGQERSPAPIDRATRTRQSCLSLLTRARRASSADGGPRALGEQLLGELSAYARRSGGLTVQRDERGVVVVLRQVFERDAVRPEVRARLAELDRVAAAHPSFPIAVVVHTEQALSSGDEPAWQARASRVADAFASRAPERRLVVVAGNALPLVDVQSRDRAKNARVEIVFLSSEAL